MLTVGSVRRSAGKQAGRVSGPEPPHRLEVGRRRHLGPDGAAPFDERGEERGTGTGARIALASISARRQIEATVRQITKIETAIEPRFQEHFVAASAIPNAVDPFPELMKIVSLPDVNFNTQGGSDSPRRRARR